MAEPLNQFNAAQYTANLRANSQRQRDLLRRYTDRPFGDRAAMTDIDDELSFLEDWLIHHPPLQQRDDGLWVPRTSGRVLLPTEDPALIRLGLVPKVRHPSDFDITPIPKQDWADIINDPNNIEIPKWIKIILDQDGVGSCASEGATGSGMVTRNRQGLPHVDLQPWSLYGPASGYVDRGSSLQANIALMQERGVVPMSVWPRSLGWKKKWTDADYEAAKPFKLPEDGVISFVSGNRDADETMYGTLLFLGWPVFSGYSGHAWFGCGIISTTKILWCNSWGQGWGDNGLSTLDFKKLMWSYGAYGITSMTWGIAA